jgi:NAD(P)-dependent dehydrogenase (short-subunit alcohol dehydrogenase family)
MDLPKSDPYGDREFITTERRKTLQFDGQTVLVTGANRGLGARLVESVLDAGAAKVWAAARDPERFTADALADERVAPLQLDITNRASVEAAARRATDLDVLINNAGVLCVGGPLEGDLDVFERDVMTNYLGTLRVTRAFVPILERNAPAALVNILTVIALAPIRSLAGYCASKAASHSMTQALRSELKGRGIDVIGAYPGGIDTDMVAGVEMMKTSPDEVATRIVEGVQAGESIIWPDPVSAGGGGAYLGNPIALEEMLAAF